MALESIAVFEGSSASLMALIKGNAGTNITQASISSITCNIYDSISLALSSSPTVTVSTSVFDTLQTDARWSLDTTGYNFRHDLPTTAFPDGNTSLSIEYLFTPVSGNAFRFSVSAYVRPLSST